MTQVFFKDRQGRTRGPMHVKSILVYHDPAMRIYRTTPSTPVYQTQNKIDVQKYLKNPIVLDWHKTMSRPDVHEVALQLLKSGKDVRVATWGGTSKKGRDQLLKEGFQVISGHAAKHRQYDKAHVVVDDRDTELGYAERHSEIKDQVRLSPDEFVKIYKDGCK